MKTKVIFLYHRENDDLYAFFPEMGYNERLYGKEMKTAYSHVGQHCACHIDYVKVSVPATEDQYLNLKNELTDVVGYDLEIVEKRDWLKTIR